MIFLHTQRLVENYNALEGVLEKFSKNIEKTRICDIEKIETQTFCVLLRLKRFKYFYKQVTEAFLIILSYQCNSRY